ncbi:DNA-binding transcriptional regulator, LacI/PurR family [Pseudobutyrivibrio ruminis]|uniref:DNA-binding transcriptional regulator, LacI/PurR family n=1 Tax=Pseudobutyrivibrio ruminis TaxID=46206 RepID=A0A1H7H9A3_9FIRM|nr:LacI family DNA-binding transcriptional regulator [Pseudobutyrivibrio ruminis]SEK46819.1 DNA-binding transcriptional regulator, LacI/PurR family [Pseudobutyrivibrio ruminis]
MGYTLDKIAKELGLSKTTVSRAISGKGRISEETRAKVNDFIKEINYRPSAVARSLAASRTFNVGLVFPADSALGEMPYFQTLMTGVCDRAMEYEYDVLIILADNDGISALKHAVRNKKIDAVMVSRCEQDSKVINFLKEAAIPYIVVGDPMEPGVPFIDHDNEGAATRMIETLIDKGITRMALIGGGENINVTHSRLAGFRQGFINRGMKADENQIYLNMHKSDRMDKVLKTAIAEGAECIVCMDDMLCNSVLNCLHNDGLSVPEDIKLCSFYDSNLLSTSKPSITSLYFDAKKLGAEGLSMLMRNLDGEDVTNLTLSDFNIQMRDSTN